MEIKINPKDFFVKIHIEAMLRLNPTEEVYSIKMIGMRKLFTGPNDFKSQHPHFIDTSQLEIVECRQWKTFHIKDPVPGMTNDGTVVYSEIWNPETLQFDVQYSSATLRVPVYVIFDGINNKFITD
jgi:hypothetical protein